MTNKFLFHQFFAMLIVLLTGSLVSGQQAVIKIIDKKTGEPVPYAHVCFESVKDKQQLHDLTNDDGAVVNPVHDRSVMAVSFIGYETLFDTIVPGESRTYKFKPAIFDMDEVVVTAQYVPQKVDKSIYKINVIGAKEINRKGANNLSELFSNELSIRVNQDAALGSSMNIRGLGGEHVKFLVNGIPVIGRLNGNIDLGQLNLNDVDHIEMIEGPMSVVYGSNALAGVVNIITKENKNTPLTASADAYVESVGTYNFNGSVAGKHKNSILGISGGRNFFQGFSDNDTSRSMLWKPKRQYMLDAYYIYNHPKFKIKYAPQVFNELLLNKGNVILPIYAFDTYFRTNRLNNTLDFSTKIGSDRYFKLLGAYSIYERVKKTYFKNLHTLNETLSDNTGDQDTTKFNALNIRTEMSKSNADSKFNYQFGLDLNLENGTGRKIVNKKQQIGDYAAYLSLKLDPVPVLTIQPGVRFIYNTKYHAPLVYSLNLKWDLLEHSTLRASYSRGFRAPALKELYLYFVDVNHNIRGNEDLKAENSHNVVVSMDYNKEEGKADWGLTGSLFYNSINNIITIAQETSDLYTYINVDNYTSQGLQLDLFYNLYPWFQWKIGLAETGRKNVVEGEIPQAKDFLYSTDVNTSISYNFRKIGVGASLYYKYTGRLPQYYTARGGELKEGFVEEYNMMDFTVTKDLFKKMIRISGGVKNLFDVKSIHSAGAPVGSVHGGSGSTLIGYGRSYFVSLSYTFNKF